MDQPGKAANPARGQLNRENCVYIIGTQLHGPINSGQTRWRVAVLNKYMDAAAELGRKVSTRFSLSMEMSRLTRDGTAELVSRDRRTVAHARPARSGG